MNNSKIQVYDCGFSLAQSKTVYFLISIRNLILIKFQIQVESGLGQDGGSAGLYSVKVLLTEDFRNARGILFLESSTDPSYSSNQGSTYRKNNYLYTIKSFSFRR